MSREYALRSPHGRITQATLLPGTERSLVLRLHAFSYVPRVFHAFPTSTALQALANLYHADSPLKLGNVTQGRPTRPTRARGSDIRSFRPQSSGRPAFFLPRSRHIRLRPSVTHTLQGL